ncbi:MFS general substrate transporter [Aspergillus sclerotiicarbonarius CBS 121057]|uniref:MFS general substrate transporter n=1 Tax=Aspergillus sclerotiicarbonarius (strain CBS 121057 / IBT 28362) TaxID=1448318 RepID=A0A319FKA5_ASPSB|nr:MFS general substrate transporter [Aspergillus sclerotiicarbonarius CBS 121057]
MSPSDCSETAPLLRPDDSHERGSSPAPRADYRTLSLVVGAIIFLAKFADELLKAPMLAALELAVCQRSSPTTPCDLASVGPVVASLRGTAGMLGALPGLTVGYVYGSLSHHWGKRTVLLLATLGMALETAWFVLVCAQPSIFPPSAVLGSFTFLFIGGGPQVFNALLLTVLAEVVPNTEQTAFFWRTGAAGLVSTFIAPPASGAMMSVLPAVVVCVVGVAIFSLLFPLILYLPGTAAAATPVERGATDGHTESPQSILRSIRSGWKENTRLISGLLSHGGVVRSAAFADLVSTLAPNILIILLQHMSNRFGWSHAEATLIYSIKGGISLVLFTVGLPWIHRYLAHRLRLSSPWPDLWMSRALILFLMGGSLLIGVAQTASWAIAGLALFSCGTGISMSLKSASAISVPKDQVARLYTGLAAVETLGAILGSPLLSWVYAATLRAHHPAFEGAPFLLSSLAYSAAAIAIWTVSVY